MWWLWLWLLSSSPVGAAPTEAEARLVQLRETIEKLAAKNHWNGVERQWTELVALDLPIPVELWRIGAQAARLRGDTWNAYQRLVQVLKLTPDDPDALAQMREIRDHYGRVTVWRVEATPIALTAAETPFHPDQRASITFAAETLAETGGFDGMLPRGTYTLGPHSLVVGAEPVVLRRVAGDGDKR